MGLTKQSTGTGIFDARMHVVCTSPDDRVIALAGNPNVGKSTVFNSLTGLNQHTGNWPGKTVTNAQGRYRHKGTNFIMVDLPGTYSLMSDSIEEEVARDFVCFGKPDTTVVVTDATCLERNLNLVIQTIEMTSRVVVCVNLIDEAKRKGISIDCSKVSERLGVPVVATNARNGRGLNQLMDAVHNVSQEDYSPKSLHVMYENAVEDALSILEKSISGLACSSISNRWIALKLLDGEPVILESLCRYLGFDLLQENSVNDALLSARKHLEDNGIEPDRLRDRVVSSIVCTAEEICKGAVTFKNQNYTRTDRKIDSIITSRVFGIPIMMGVLALVFWLTISGANVPSSIIAGFLFGIEAVLSDFFITLGSPEWLHGILVLGVYRTLAWVISVMLPPMAIFFPLFTLLEDLGYLPRVAFNLDNFFKKACAHGKQALTMCMGFGCNAAGVIGCRIINSPRERIIAIITNVFVPCNGRFAPPHKEKQICSTGLTKKRNRKAHIKISNIKPTLSCMAVPQRLI